MLTSVDPIAAFAGGLLSFLSPCVLALVPGYLACLGGTSVENGTNRRTMVTNAAIFVAGFSAVFILLFAVFRALVVDLPIDYKNLLTEVGAVIIIFLGLQFLGLFRVPFLQREGRLSIAHRLQAGSPVSALLVGTTFGLGWTPCVGPILTFIILRASSHDIVGGVGLTVLYCAGLAVPFLTASPLLERVRALLRPLNAHAGRVESAPRGPRAGGARRAHTRQGPLSPQW